MTPVTIHQVCKEYKITQTVLAEQLGVCVSQISKIKWNAAYITNNFQEKFQKYYPEYILVNNYSNVRKIILEQELEIEGYKRKPEKVEGYYPLFMRLLTDKIAANKELIKSPLLTRKAKKQLKEENKEMELILNEREDH